MIFRTKFSSVAESFRAFPLLTQKLWVKLSENFYEFLLQMSLEFYKGWVKSWNSRQHWRMVLGTITDHSELPKTHPFTVGCTESWSIPKYESFLNYVWRHRTWRNRLTGHFKWKSVGQTICGRSLMVIASLDKVLERILLTSILPSKSENSKKNPRIRGGELGMVPLREVDGDEAPPLKKFSSKLKGKSFSLFKLGDPKLPYLISGLTSFQSPDMY